MSTEPNKPANPPAFPEIETVLSSDDCHNDYPATFSRGGMTLLDYFAAKAIQGKADEQGYGQGHAQAFAKDAYALAAAMLAEREKHL